MAASAAGGSEFRLWDLERGQCCALLDYTRVEPLFLRACVSLDGKRAVTGGKEPALFAWDLEIEELDGKVSLTGPSTAAAIASIDAHWELTQ